MWTNHPSYWGAQFGVHPYYAATQVGQRLVNPQFSGSGSGPVLGSGVLTPGGFIPGGYGPGLGSSAPGGFGPGLGLAPNPNVLVTPPRTVTVTETETNWRDLLMGAVGGALLAVLLGRVL